MSEKTLVCYRGWGEERSGGRWLIITKCKAAVNKDVDLVVKHVSGRVGIN